MRRGQVRKVRLRDVLRWIVLAVCAAMVGFQVYAINARQLLGNQMPMPFGYGSAVVLSGSMEPTLSVGDLIIVKETQTLTENQIIVYAQTGSLVVHRIKTISGSQIIAQGDANNAPDAPIDAFCVKGEVVAVVPGAGSVVEAIRSPAGILVIVGLAAVLLELPHLRRKKKDEQELDQLKEEIRRLKEEL